MANTTNFGWETPDDTDLVKDGALAIRTLGSAIDTSLVDLKGGTTGQVLSKNSNTDMDFVWTTSDDANAIQNAIVDAKGDLITATAADTPARLAVGANERRLVADSAEATGLKWVADTTNYAIAAKGDLLAGTAADTVAALSVGSNGQVLTADSSTATGLKWAAAASSGLTLISSTTFTSSSAHSVNDVFSSTYDNYLVWVTVTGASISDFVNMRLRVSGSDNSSSNYYWSHLFNQAATTTVTGEGATAATSLRLGYMETTSTNFNTVIAISGPFLTTNTVLSWDHNRYATNNSTNQKGSGTLNVTTSYTGFTILPASGNITGRVRVYGYQNS